MSSPIHLVQLDTGEENGATFEKSDEIIASSSTSSSRRVPAFVPIISWILCSSGVIFMNKFILSDRKYSHPVALTTFHLTFQVIATRFARHSTSLVDGAKLLESTGKLTTAIYRNKIIPIGVLFSLSLVLSNYVYLRLSLSFIQMLKAFTPVSILMIEFSLGLKERSRKLLVIVVCISLGVAIASYGEEGFDMIGFLVQALAIAIESARIVMIQIVLKDMSMDPITSLYYFAPVCLSVNAVLLLPFEGLQPFYDLGLIGIPLLVLNAASTFLLNLSSVWLIGSTSALVLTLAGVIKDILLIASSYVILGSSITLLQLFGYAIALGGLIAFKLAK